MDCPDFFKAAKRLKRGAYRTKAGREILNRECNIMGRFAEHRARAQEDAGNYFTKEERNELHKNAVPLMITSVKFDEGGGMEKDTDRWLVTLERTDNGEAKKIGLADNAFRRSLFDGLLEDDEFPVGPVTLGKIKTNRGQDAWDLVEVD